MDDVLSDNDNDDDDAMCDAMMKEDTRRPPWLRLYFYYDADFNVVWYVQVDTPLYCSRGMLQYRDKPAGSFFGSLMLSFVAVIDVEMSVKTRRELLSNVACSCWTNDFANRDDFRSDVVSPLVWKE